MGIENVAADQGPAVAVCPRAFGNAFGKPAGRELYTVVGFIDDRRLGPAYRFFHRHQVVDEKGRVQGYKNLDELRDTLRPILLRRTRGTIMQDLPERTTEIIRIPATQEQFEMSEEYTKQAAKIAAKRYLTEMDLLRLQKYLLMARMSADMHIPGR